MPIISNSSYLRAPDLNIRVEGGTKKLKGLTAPPPPPPTLTLLPDILPYYQASVEQCQIPKEWKTANVSPVF